MSKLSISLWFTILVISSFCNKDFVLLGRHSWRCREDVLNTRNFGNDQDSNFERLQLNHCCNKALLLTFIMCLVDMEKNVKDFAVLKHTNTPVAL